MTDVTEWVKRQMLAPMSGWYLLMFVMMAISLLIFLLFIPAACGSIEKVALDSGEITEDFHTIAPDLFRLATLVWQVFFAYVLFSLGACVAPLVWKRIKKADDNMFGFDRMKNPELFVASFICISTIAAVCFATFIHATGAPFDIGIKMMISFITTAGFDCYIIIRFLIWRSEKLKELK